MALIHDLFGGKEKKPGIRSKDKGNANELQVCKVLEFWTGKKFKRTPGSGALRWDDTNKIAGDVTCDVSGYRFPFSVETKHLKDVNIKRKLGKRSMIYTIMKQGVFDADRSNRLPILLLRPNNMESFRINRMKYQNYYAVFLYKYGGRILHKDFNIPLLFWGKDEATKFDVIGFDFKTLISTVNFADLSKALAEANLEYGFTETNKAHYTWSY